MFQTATYSTNKMWKIDPSNSCLLQLYRCDEVTPADDAIFRMLSRLVERIVEKILGVELQCVNIQNDTNCSLFILLISGTQGTLILTLSLNKWQ